jgi:hypothetical protein
MISFFAAHWIALLSTLGIGAAGAAALIFIPGAAGIALELLRGFDDWLSRRTLGEIGFIVLSCLSLFLLFRCDHWKSVATQRQAQLVKCGQDKAGLQSQLDAISSRKNEQQIVTKTRIEMVIKVIHDAEKRAKEIENTPSAPGDCQRATPPAIVAEEGF